MTRTKTKRRNPAQRDLPTMAQAARYIAEKRPRPLPVSRGHSRSAAVVTPAEAQPEGPELVLALDRADEFPRLTDQCGPAHGDDRHLWRFDVRLDMLDGRRLYRHCSIAAADRDKALAALRERFGALRTITVYAIHPPPTFGDLDLIAAANKRLRQVRDRCGAVRSEDDLAKQVAQLSF